MELKGFQKKKMDRDDFPGVVEVVEESTAIPLRARTGSATVRPPYYGTPPLFCYSTGEGYGDLCARLCGLFKKHNVAAVDTCLGYSCCYFEDLCVEFSLEIFQEGPGQVVEFNHLCGDRGAYRRFLAVFGLELGMDWATRWPYIEEVDARIEDLLTPSHGKFGETHKNYIRAMRFLSKTPRSAPFMKIVMDYKAADSEYNMNLLKLLAVRPEFMTVDLLAEMPQFNGQVRRMLLRCALVLVQTEFAQEVKAKMTPLALAELARADMEESCRCAAEFLTF